MMEKALWCVAMAVWLVLLYGLLVAHWPYQQSSGFVGLCTYAVMVPLAAYVVRRASR